jgi:2-polyprenyl-3-methyl-5-hydroxy-6-metoxy-1,4-benzoquinol methylase
MRHETGHHEEIEFTEEYWDGRYGSAHRMWSGNPNPHVVTVAEGLTPGDALDIGCGEGADAVWLAAHGWRVLGVDVSGVALERAAAHAADAGPEVAARITWTRADALAWDPGTDRYDLVSAQFMQLPKAELESLHRRLAAAVRPGGTLLIVGHDVSDLDTSVQRPHRHDLMFTAEQVAVTLDADRWKVEASTPSRTVLDPDGRPTEIHDAVIRATRR